MKLTSLWIAVAFGAVNFAAWAWMNQPTTEPPWPRRIQGFAFSPYRADQDAVRGDLPSRAEIEADLALLAGKTNAVRTYSTEGSLGEVPRLAERHDINVALGAWIDGRPEHDERARARSAWQARIGTSCA